VKYSNKGNNVNVNRVVVEKIWRKNIEFEEFEKRKREKKVIKGEVLRWIRWCDIESEWGLLSGDSSWNWFIYGGYFNLLNLMLIFFIINK
jgi:hypothetical protein